MTKKKEDTLVIDVAELIRENVSDKKIENHMKRLVKGLFGIKYEYSNKVYGQIVSPRTLGYSIVKKYINISINNNIEDFVTDSIKTQVNDLVKIHMRTFKLNITTKTHINKTLSKYAKEYFDGLSDTKKEKIIVEHVLRGK